MAIKTKADLTRLRKQSQRLVNALTKAELTEKLKAYSRFETVAGIENLRTLTKQAIKKDDALLRDLYHTYQERFCLHPSDVEQLLGITPTERKKWQETKLPVDHYESIRLYGATVDVPYFDLLMILSVSPAKIQQWRQAAATQKKANQKAAVKKRQATLQAHQALQKAFASEFEDTKASWMHTSPLLAATFNVAYWTMWASRWAKENQLKQKRAIKYQVKYGELKDMWYTLKNEGIQQLIKSPYSTQSFYCPEHPHKFTVQLCQGHYEQWRDEREMMFDYYGKFDFVADHEREIKACGACDYRQQTNFYALYYLTVESTHFSDVKFSFHTPAPLGGDWFDPIETLPKVYHEESEGLFRFGRTLTSDEKIIHTEAVVKRELEAAIMTLMQLTNTVTADEVVS